MAFKIRWTHEADENFASIINYLENEWSEKEVRKFAFETQRVIAQIAIFPKMFKSSGKEGIRKATITRQTSIFYHIVENQNTIILLTFWDNRKNPNKSGF